MTHNPAQDRSGDLVAGLPTSSLLAHRRTAAKRFRRASALALLMAPALLISCGGVDPAAPGDAAATAPAAANDPAAPAAPPAQPAPVPTPAPVPGPAPTPDPVTPAPGGPAVDKFGITMI